MHSWNCPDDYEARSRARWDAERDASSRWGRSYSSPYDCDHASEEYRREYDYQYRQAEEQQAEERRAATRREQARQQEEWEMQQAYEAAEMQRQEEEWLAEQEEAYHESLRDAASNPHARDGDEKEK